MKFRIFYVPDFFHQTQIIVPKNWCPNQWFFFRFRWIFFRFRWIFYRFRISPDFQIANTTPQQRNSSERVIEQNTKPSVWHVTAQLWGISTVEKGSRFRLGSANRSESKCGITRAEWLLFNLFYSPCASSFGHPDPSTRGELPPRRSWNQDRSLSEPPPRWIWR